MVSRTVVCPTEASNRKVERIRPFIDEWQDVARTVAERFPSFKRHQWGQTQMGTLYRLSTDGDHINLASSLEQAGMKVSEAFGSWKERGCQGDRPIGHFGRADYMRVRDKQVEIVENDRGYGIKINIEPYADPLWLHLDTAEYHESYLERVVDPNDDARVGNTEIHLVDEKDIRVHIAISYDIDVMRVDDATKYLGVDLGENVIYAAAVVDDAGDIEGVEIKSGREFRHHREELSDRMSNISSGGDLQRLKERLSGQRERYTENEMDVASREIVDMADDHRSCVIVTEDLGGYRESADDPIHDWPNHMLRQKIAYKAEDLGIPVVEIGAHYTSQTCSSCGRTDGDSRDGRRFVCIECGYDADADFNAAVNIANRYRKS